MPRVIVFRSRFFWKLYSTFSCVFLSVTLVLAWVLYVKVQGTIKDNAAGALRDKLSFLAPQIRSNLSEGPEALEAAVHRLASNTDSHITVFGPSGDLWADSASEGRVGESGREWLEVQRALAGQVGVAQRLETTQSYQVLYVAKGIYDGEDLVGVVRVSQPMTRILESMRDLWITVGLVGMVAVIFALALGWTLTRKIMLPIAEMVAVAEALRHGHYDRKVLTLTSDEIGRLGDTLNRLGAEITRRISEMERLENIRRDFVANVSHEIKTPLTSIKGYVETLLSGAMDDPKRRVRFLEKIGNNAERLTLLVQDILSLARIEASEAVFRPQPTEVGPILFSMLARYEDALGSKGLRIKFNAAPPPVVAMGDKESLIQVLDNLMTNAIKYTPEGGLITLTLAVMSDWVRIDVEDTGIGIAAEDLGRIFERFYRVDKARSRDLGGTGLGLAIVKHLVANMGGEIGVESTVGVGSKFSIRLPAAS